MKHESERSSQKGKNSFQVSFNYVNMNTFHDFGIFSLFPRVLARGEVTLLDYGGL